MGGDLEGDVFVLGNRLIEIANFAHEVRQRDLAESRQPAALLDLRTTRERRDYAERLVETADRAIHHGAQIRQSLRILAAAFQADAHARERRTQVMRDVVADPSYAYDQRL